MNIQQLIDISNEQIPASAGAAQLQSLADNFPYCSAFQSLHYSALPNPDKRQQQLVSLHKGNIYLLSKRLSTVANHVETEILQEEGAPIFESLSSVDYFAAQGVDHGEEDIADFVAQQKQSRASASTAETTLTASEEPIDEDAQLLVTRSFTEWLDYFKQKKEKESKETEGKEKLRSMWQKAKLAAAAEEDDEVVPEEVFEQAMNSISLSSDTVSEALAKVLEAQGKYEKAISMYRKLSLLYPEKSSYFAAQINKIDK
ncbi:MAG: hypothetical protein RL660_342 [Bacteroidota bacterium]|jgi:tetratricopeptide (TPR) repeat protein